MQSTGPFVTGRLNFSFRAPCTTTQVCMRLDPSAIRVNKLLHVPIAYMPKKIHVTPAHYSRVLPSACHQNLVANLVGSLALFVK
jgi:hypothetical protein